MKNIRAFQTEFIDDIAFEEFECDHDMTGKYTVSPKHAFSQVRDIDFDTKSINNTEVSEKQQRR